MAKKRFDKNLENIFGTSILKLVAVKLKLGVILVIFDWVVKVNGAVLGTEFHCCCDAFPVPQFLPGITTM